MKLAEAKEILEKEEEDTWMGNEAQWKLALRICIEAAEREIANRDSPDFVKVGKLPSETWEIKRK